MKRAICLMVIGEKYQIIYEKLRHQFELYSNKCNADLIIIDRILDKSCHRPILSQKLLIPNELIDFDEVLFMDLDIIISKNAPNIFDEFPSEKHFGAVLDSRGTDEFNKTWGYIPRTLKETSESYFTDRDFQKNNKLLGSINGGVFLFRPKIIAPIFKEYYFSNHNQGRFNSYEEAPMAYITQINDLFFAINPLFNVQVLYKIKGTDEGNKASFYGRGIPEIAFKIYKKISGNATFPTNKYFNFIDKIIENSYFVHFAGGYPFLKK